jgi:hypothetical protein
MICPGGSCEWGCTYNPAWVETWLNLGTASYVCRKCRARRYERHGEYVVERAERDEPSPVALVFFGLTREGQPSG